MHMPAESLDERLDADFAPAWNPEPGEKIVGEVVALSERTGPYGNKYPIVTLRGPNGGERAVHAFHTVLAQKLAETAPKVGETLGIKYVGKVEGGSGADGYHKYNVAVDRADGGIEWSAYSEDAPAPTTEEPRGDREAAMRLLHEPLPEPAPETAASPADDIPF